MFGVYHMYMKTYKTTITVDSNLPVQKMFKDESLFEKHAFALSEQNVTTLIWSLLPRKTSVNTSITDIAIMNNLNLNLKNSIQPKKIKCFIEITITFQLLRIK